MTGNRAAQSGGRRLVKAKDYLAGEEAMAGGNMEENKERSSVQRLITQKRGLLRGWVKLSSDNDNWASSTQKNGCRDSI